MDLPLSDGWIEVITGGMYAGKTEELLRRIKRLDYAKRPYVLFKPQVDNRYSDVEVVSHNDRRGKAIVISDPHDIFKYLKPETYAVGIDEAQFFDASLVEVVEELADRGVRVIVAGLDCDFKGEPFGVMPELLARAEYVTKLKAICQVCGAPASRTQRLINGKPARRSDPIILVGANDHYEARCRQCHEVRDED